MCTYRRDSNALKLRGGVQIDEFRAVGKLCIENLGCPAVPVGGCILLYCLVYSVYRKYGCKNGAGKFRGDDIIGLTDTKDARMVK